MVYAGLELPMQPGWPQTQGDPPASEAGSTVVLGGARSDSAGTRRAGLPAGQGV